MARPRSQSSQKKKGRPGPRRTRQSGVGKMTPAQVRKAAATESASGQTTGDQIREQVLVLPKNPTFAQGVALIGTAMLNPQIAAAMNRPDTATGKLADEAALREEQARRQFMGQVAQHEGKTLEHYGVGIMDQMVRDTMQIHGTQTGRVSSGPNKSASPRSANIPNIAPPQPVSPSVDSAVERDRMNAADTMDRLDRTRVEIKELKEKIRATDYQVNEYHPLLQQLMNLTNDYAGLVRHMLSLTP